MAKRGKNGDNWIYGEEEPRPSLAVLDGWARLAAGILAKAAAEARSGDLGACEWLSGPDAAVYAGVIGMDTEVIRRQAQAWAGQPAGKIIIRICAEVI